MFAKFTVNETQVHPSTVTVKSIITNTDVGIKIPARTTLKLDAAKIAKAQADAAWIMGKFGK